jgi:hypothetical protein
LINFLQLRSQANDPALTPLTRDLARQAVEDYAKNLRESPLEKLAWTGLIARQLKRAAFVLIVFGGLLLAVLPVTKVELARFADPYGDHPPYSLTRLEIVEPSTGGTNVLYGRSFVVKAKAAGHQPKELFLTAHPVGAPEKAVTLPMFDKGSAGFHQLLDNVRAETVVYVHTKDRASVSKQHRLGVILTPQLEQARVRIVPPAYTGLPAEEKPYEFKPLRALTGSKLEFRLRSNRPLREGTMELIGGSETAQQIPLTAASEFEVMCSVAVADSGRLRFSLVDVDGLPSQEQWEGGLTVTHDLPPTVHLAEPERDAMVSMDLVVKVHIEAADDYGLRTVRLHRALNGIYSSPLVMSYDKVVRDAHELVELDLAHLGIVPGDIISLYAEAVDSAPEPHLARSQVVQLMVISVEEYNQMLREQTDLADTHAKYSGLMNELQDLIEGQRKLEQAAQRLQEEMAKADARQQEELSRALDGMLARQNELNHQLEKQAERMEKFVRDLPLYDVEKELKDALDKQAAGVRNSAATNQLAMEQIAKRSVNANGGRQLSPELMKDFQQESKDQIERLGGGQQETKKEVLETLAEMSQMQELMKDFNQFETLHRVQQELTAQAQAYDRPGQLNREDQLALKDLASVEKQVGDALLQLEKKLRQDADAAEKLFPKAAKSGRDLADAINEQRFESMARQATSQMLAAKGSESYQMADRLRQEMEKLFQQCQGSGGNCPGSKELDNYLQLKRGLNAGNNFNQMSQCRKFGLGKGQRPGSGSGMAAGMSAGMGETGEAGYAMPGAPPMGIMGREAIPNGGNATARASSELGRGQGAGPGGNTDSLKEGADVLTGLNPVNRQSGAVASESVAEEYSDLVDRYFEAITTRKKP